MSKAVIVGLTGPTGAGKSTVSKMLTELSETVIDCDLLARAAVQIPEVIDALCLEFGNDIVKDGTLDRRLLASKAFCSEAGRAALGRITFPAIMELLRERIKALESAGISRIILDAPTLFESGADNICDKVIAVTASETLRLSRIIARDNIKSGDAVIRMNAGKPEGFYKSRSDFFIENNSDEVRLLQDVENVLASL